YDIAGKDGMYKGGKIIAYDDPYFANLQFLNAKLGNELKGEDEVFDTMADPNPALESFLLFDMNGATYVIREESLKRITGSTKTGQIIPFFSPASLPSAGSPGGTKQQTTTGRAEVTIGADGAGNLSAVYVGTVPNTTNNALYLTKYDPTSAKWGVGTMLAMNYMQVHEDSIARGMYADDAEKAFLGKLPGYDKGGMDQFKFSNLQIALGQTKTTDAGGLSLSADANGVVTVPGPPPLETSLLEAPPDTGLSAAGDGTKDTLLVITQGSMTYLEEKEVNVGETKSMLAPLSDAAAKAKHAEYVKTNDPLANRVPGIGVYAVSYGAGGQAIGESHLTFADYNFSSGKELKAGLSFFNTGDVAIRASDANKATVKLMLRTADKGDSAIATWNLTQNVLAGQKVILSGICDALTTDLPAGSIFYIEVSEDPDYAGTPFTANTLKTITEGGTTTYVGDLTVGSKAELGFAKMGTSIKPVAMDENGNTVLDVQFKAENRGNKIAPDVFVQFSYDNGSKDDNGNPVYVPLDISTNTLQVSKLQELDPLAVSKNDFKNGIFYLNNAEDGNDITTNHGRTVSGTITVPSNLYKGSLTGSLNINVEIFSADDSVTDWQAALVTARHAEYDTNNNRFATQVEHNSFFQSAAKVAIPMGTTMRLPLQVSTTKNTAPNIAVDEVPANGEKTHLGIRYYQPGKFDKGRESGTLVLAPSSEGSGVLHLKDVNTNALYAVAYTVTAAGDGINIFNDTDMFAFKNAGGGDYDPTALGAKDWQFEKGVPTWGEPVKDVTNPAPYLSDLAKGKKDTSFTYRTQAQSMQLYFNGEVKVTSDLPGFTEQTVSATGGNSFAMVSFGTNKNNVPHNVTITVTKAPGGYADFDRIVETFGTKDPPKPSDDKNAPHLFWSRSFPDTATLASGSIPLTCYILDDGSLASLTVNGKEPTGITKTAENFWKFSLTVSANGPISVAATDTAGNRTARTVMVDWFNTPASSTGSSAAPNLTAKLVKADGTELKDYLKSGESAYVKAESTTSPTPTYSASYYVKDKIGGIGLVETPLTDAGKGFPATGNGYYVVTAKNTNAKEWATTVVYMDKIDIALPVVTLTKDDTT
ncbi:MAG: hypothetical protein RR336_05520, partial [Oscillospiraceae bacterium]